MNNHRKNSCFDSNKALREGMVHFIDEADRKTRLGPMESGGPIAPLPESTQVWQKVWVSNARRQKESQGEVPASTNSSRIAEVGQGSTSEVGS